MRYMIHFEATVEAGEKIEAAGGPGAFFEYVGKKFRPEAMYFVPTRREGWFVVDVTEPRDLAEITIAFSSRFGAYPTFTPVVPPAEFGPMVAEAVRAARDAP